MIDLVDESDDVLDVAGAAKLLHVGRDSVYVAVGRLQIPHRRVGRHIRFSRRALLRWLDSGGSSEPCVSEPGAEKGR